MKRTLTLILTLVLIISGFTYIKFYKNPGINDIYSKPLADGKVSFVPKNFSDLINNSQVIVEAEATDNRKEFSYLKANFVQTDLKIKKIYKGTSLVNGNNIWLLQTLMMQDPIIKNGEKVLLFLDKYEGPVTSDETFVLKGLYQGHYKIINDEIRPSFPLTGTLNEELAKYKSYDKMVEKLIKETNQ